MNAEFHVFAHEDEGNMGDTSEERIAIATDRSLDEGAILRATGQGDSPLGTDPAYFMGLDYCEAQGVRLALEQYRVTNPSEFANLWGEAVLARVNRLLAEVSQ